MFFNPDFSVIDAAIVKDPKNEDLIMVVKNENSIRRRKISALPVPEICRKDSPTKVSPSITGNYWAEGPAPCLWVIHSMFISINTVTTVTVQSVHWIMARLGKMCPIWFHSPWHPSWDGFCCGCFRCGNFDSKS